MIKIISKEEANRELLDDFIYIRGEGIGLDKEMFRYLRRRMGSVEDAEEVLNEVHLKAWENKDKYDVSKNLRPWLFTMARNRAIDRKRRNNSYRARVKSLEDLEEYCGEGVTIEPRSSETSIVDEVANKEMGEKLRGCVGRLSERYRNVVLSIYFQGLKYRETAEVLDIPEGTVKSRLHWGIQKLGDMMSKKYQDVLEVLKREA